MNHQDQEHEQRLCSSSGSAVGEGQSSEDSMLRDWATIAGFGKSPSRYSRSEPLYTPL